jgi:hypothetical protein
MRNAARKFQLQFVAHVLSTPQLRSACSMGSSVLLSEQKEAARNGIEL